MLDILRLELNRNVCKLSIFAFLIFIIFELIIIQIGIGKYNTDLKEQQEFLQSEEQVIERFINYHMYAGYGFRRFLEPSAILPLFYNSTTLDDLHMFLDSGVRLRLNKNEIGKGLFDRPTGGTLDFSWFLVVVGGLVCTLWGFFTFRNTEYLKFLLDYGSKKIVYLWLLLSRIILIIFSLVIINCFIFVLFLINGLHLTTGLTSGLLLFFMTSILVMIILITVSAGIGAMKNWIKGLCYAGALFFVLIFLLPEILNTVFSKVSESKMTSAYKLESQKMERLMSFEKVAYEYTSRFNEVKEKKEADRIFTEENWWDKGFKEVEKMESEMLNITQDLARKFQLLSIISPVTFYKCVNNEISSKGFNAYLSFYKEGQELQKGFLRYFLDKKSFNPYEKVVPYLKTEELVTKSTPSLPSYFFTGVMLLLFYIVLAVFFSYSRFKKFIFPIINGNSENVDMQFNKKESIQFTYDESSKNLFFNILNGKIAKFKGKITINGVNLITKAKKDYFYFPDIEKLPGNLSVKSLCSLAKISTGNMDKRLKDLDLEEKFKLFLKIAKNIKKEIYVFNIVFPGNQFELLRAAKEEIKSFKTKDTTVFYFGAIGLSPLEILDPDKIKLFLLYKGEFQYLDSHNINIFK